MSQAAFFSGINRYRYSPEDNLRGCVQDSIDLRELFQTRLWFTLDECAVQWDADNDKVGMVRGLNILVEDAPNLERVIWTHSSHGTTNPWPEEPDGVEGAICCHDIREQRGGWNPNTILTEHELFDILKVVPLSCLFEAILDTCFAGEWAELRLMARRHGAARFMPGLNIVPKPLLHRLMEQRLYENIVVWAACRPEQTSAEDFLEGLWRGVFTYFFRQEFRPDLTRKELLAKVDRALTLGGYSQTPVLLCNDRLLNLPVGEF